MSFPRNTEGKINLSALENEINTNLNLGFSSGKIVCEIITPNEVDAEEIKNHFKEKYNVIPGKAGDNYIIHIKWNAHIAEKIMNLLEELQ